MALSNLAKCPAFTAEESNFLRFVNLVIRVSPRAVRMIFDKYFPPSGLKIVLNQHKVKLDKLHNRKIITNYQKDILYPKQGNADVNSSDFDITLIVILLRNIHKMNVSDELPEENDVSEAADVSRIKYYRNWTAHSTEGIMKDEDFENAWKSVSKAIERLGGISMKRDCDILLTADLDSTYKEIYNSFILQERRFEATEMELERLTIKVTELESDVKNVRENISTELESWIEEDKKFYSTSAVAKILPQVQSNPFVVISGSSGMGKTATAHHIALKLQNSDGYEIFPIKTPGEIRNFLKKNSNQIFFVDDICGKFSVNEYDIRSWIACKRDLIQLFQANKGLHILATCRLLVCKTNHFQRMSKAFKIRECDLLSTELALDMEEKLQIGACHVDSEFLCHVGEEVINKMDMFPLLCKLSAKSEAKRTPAFFKNPYSVFEQELEEMEYENKECFLGLALLVLFNNFLMKSYFYERDDSSFEEIVNELFEELEFSNKPSYRSILTAIQSAVGTFVREEKLHIETIHDRIFDIISVFFGKRLLKTILKFASTIFIAKRVKPSCADEPTGDFFIVLNRDEDDLYLQRIMDNIRKRKFLILLETDYILSADLQEKIIDIISKNEDLKYIFVLNQWLILLTAYHKSDKILQYILCERFKLQESKRSSIGDDDFGRMYQIDILLDSYEVDYIFGLDKDNADFYRMLSSSNGPLYWAIEDDRPDIVELLLKNGNNATIDEIFHSNDKYLFPFLAAYRQSNCSAKVLIEYGCNVNLCDDHGDTVLHSTCIDGNESFIEILFNTRTDDLSKEKDVSKKSAVHCDVNITNAEGKTPLLIASIVGNLYIVKRLLGTGNCDVNLFHKDQRTPLAAACQNEHDIIVETLLTHGCDVNIGNSFGNTPLHIATITNNIRIVQMLIDNNCEINCRNNYGQTPLFNACEVGSFDIALLLITNGGDGNISNSDGVTAVDVARKNNFPDIVQILTDSTLLQ